MPGPRTPMKMLAQIIRFEKIIRARGFEEAAFKPLKPGTKVTLPKDFEHKLTRREKDQIRRDISDVGIERALKKRELLLGGFERGQYILEAEKWIKVLKPTKTLTKPKIFIISTLVAYASVNAGLKRNEIANFLKSREFQELISSNKVIFLMEDLDRVEKSERINFAQKQIQQDFNRTLIQWVKRFDEKQKA